MKFLNQARKYMSEENGGDAPVGGGVPDVKPEAKPEVEAEVVTPEVEVENAEPVADNIEPEVVEPKSKLGQVTGLIEQAGLDMVAVAEYAKANDGALDLDTVKALTEKHGEAVASLLADQVKSIHASKVAESQARDKAVFDVVEEAFKGITEQSGEDTWKELATWAKEHVPNEDRKEINALLAKGGLAAKLATQELAQRFKTASGSQEYQSAELETADATNVGGGGNLTKQDYIIELNALLNAGHRYETSTAIKQLDQRRSKSIQRGI